MSACGNQDDPVALPLDRVEVVAGDITTLQVDAVVNAANEKLAGGGGVDGAIHRAADADALQAYTREHYPDGCAIGLAVRTPAFGLGPRVQHLLHAVGPVWQGAGDAPGTSEDEKLGYRHEDILLASAYGKCLSLCVELGIDTVAFPCISTGVYGFPIARAARVALGHTLGHLRQHALPERVTFCCFTADDAAVYRDAIVNRADWMYARKRI